MCIPAANDDYDHTAVPGSVILSGGSDSYCLHIPILVNSDGSNYVIESFQVVMTLCDREREHAVLVNIFEECVDGEVRLVNMESPQNSNEGRVEICMGGVFGGVCEEPSNWSVQDASVVCRQLGYYISQHSKLCTHNNYRCIATCV